MAARAAGIKQIWRLVLNRISVWQADYPHPPAVGCQLGNCCFFLRRLATIWLVCVNDWVIPTPVGA
jgi:hypothetical protein